METYGKSGVRRVIPGEYLASDPKGRACMLASVEKNKLVYVLNRDGQKEVRISSPLEAHKPGALVFALAALDTGYENPAWAALEVDYTESDQDYTGQAYRDIEKQLVYYELDLGLNHVVRKWSDAVDRTANLLFQVPGGTDGPSGVLVCGQESITYRHSNQDAFRVPIPRRRGATEDPSRRRYIICGVMHKMRGAGAFFFLLQSEDGDIFKVTLELASDDNDNKTGEVERLNIKYFDTVPPATNLCILKSGFLYVATENGDQYFYQFEKLGDDDNEMVFTSDDYPADTTAPYEAPYFHPRPLENMSRSVGIPCMNPITDCKVANLTNDDANQIYTLSGTGAHGALKTLRHGLEVSEIVESELPAKPTAVWTIKRTANDTSDAYIILSFATGTLVLSVGETVEEASDTGFLTSTPTLAVQQFGEDTLIQVYPKGIRQILANGEIKEWPSPQHRSIVAATSNQRQVAIALSSGELVYFEADSDNTLAEYDEKRQMSGGVTALSLGELPPGRLRTNFLAVGCDDSTVRIMSVAPDTCLESKSVQALTSPPSALNIMAMPDSSSGGSSLYLHIGLFSGVYLRTVIDEVTGDLSDTRTRFLGAKPAKLFRVMVKERPSILALSTRAWLGYSDSQTQAFTLTPLNYGGLEWGWNFTNEQCPEGIVGIQGKNLRIFTIDDLAENLLSESVTLRYTPRKFVLHQDYSLFYVIETENNVLPPHLREQLQNDPSVVNGDAAVLPPEDFGYPKGEKHWSSCIQVVDPVSEKEVLYTVELAENEAAVSISIAPFASQDDERFLVVGTGKDMVLQPGAPLSSTCGFIHIYRFLENGKELELIHKTKMDQPPLALLGFQGRLLVGLGKELHIFDLGLKQLLRKAKASVVPSLLVGLQTQGSRIVCSDVRESVTYVVYKHQETRLIPFVDDVVSRHTTCTTMVDYQTTAGGDKFGNLWLVRCPQAVSESSDEEGGGLHLLHEKGYLNGTPNRLDLMIHFYVQDVPVALQKAPLVAGGKDVIIWAGIQGTIGVLVPFLSREDVDFFQSLEMHLRADDAPLAGRDHLAYRSYYVPVKGVIDGDLCERFLVLDRGTKERVAAEMDRTVREVERKVQDIRTRFAF
ncbi:pre-mRNA-splicing factor rse1 [Patellaria atrata CBS 101060]|uniref:DNA damage-binding protein 1 n=1 Tax=Patellaria atrata CBS 101060 TaxID=1346257 RepID=A0A9P4SL01_9PEZI|nr:pre-mRNA-splicing factor rse1 [Patellaria atrata CBS 101060]